MRTFANLKMILNTKQLEDFDSKHGINLHQNRGSGFKRILIVFCDPILIIQQNKNCVLVASDKERAAYLLNSLGALLEDKKVLFFLRAINN